MNDAHSFFHDYLAANTADSGTLERMHGTISEFFAIAPKIIAMKCIDGRVHGSAAEGYPPTAVLSGRTDGNKVSLDKSNYWYWNRIDRAVKSAQYHAAKAPAVFIAFMHHSLCGLGCAAHKSNNAEALKSIEAQMAAVRRTYSESELFVMGGDIETDTMAEALIFLDGTRIDGADIIRQCHLESPGDVFLEALYESMSDDIITEKNSGHSTADGLFGGDAPRCFADPETSFRVQRFLLSAIATRAREERAALGRVIRPDIVDRIFGALDKAAVPASLVGPIAYQVIWNTAYSLHYRRMLEAMSDLERARHLGHAEELVCYGDGFETLPRNKSILVTPGRGDDIEALQVAKAVLEKNRGHCRQDHPPLAHINIEVSGQMMHWDDFTDSVGSRILSFQRNIDHVFGQDVAMLTSYSYRNEKRFYPVNVSRDDSRLANPEDVISAICSAREFSNISLKAEEARYRARLAKGA